MRANLEREIAASVIGGGAGTEPVELLLRKGLHNFREVRNRLWASWLHEALISLQAAKAGREYIRVALKRGASARLHLLARSGTGATPLLVTVERSRGAPLLFFDVVPAATDLAARVGTDAHAVVRVVLAIERARKRCYDLCEEARRWI